jgi:macrolide transport system ATP-binding/permease protein
MAARTGAGRDPLDVGTRAPGAPVISLLGAGRTYPGPPPVCALAEVNLVLDRGDYVAVTGPSGSGKSTLLNLLGLIDQPTRGSYEMEGVDTATLAERDRSGVRGERIGFVFQEFHLLPYRTALENVMLAQVYNGTPRRGRAGRARAALDQVGLTHRVGALPSTLSGGERQRVAIARALVNQPTLLLCDEPTGNLDSENTDALLALLDRLNMTGLTLIVITHDPQVAVRARRTLTMLDGRLTDDRAADHAGCDPARRPPPPAGRRSAVTGWLARRRRARPVPERARLGSRDLGSEALAGVLQRPGRSILTMLGVVLGIGTFITVLGLTDTTAGQIGKEFSLLQATTVTVNDVGASQSDAALTGGNPPIDFPADADARVDALDGVVQGGVWWTVPLSNPVIGSSPGVTQGSDADAGNLPIYAASAGALLAMQPAIKTGELFNDFDTARRVPVAVLGPVAAATLGISQLGSQPAIFINGTAFTVVGIISRAQRVPGLLTGIILPSTTAEQYYGTPQAASPAQMVIRTRIGAAQLIARQAPLALRPDDPGLLQSVPPPNPHALQGSVNEALSRLFLALATVCLLIGAAGIANTTLVAVLERTGEIGLRRALGARARHITAQFLVESATLGLLGGLIGTSIGVAAVVAVAIDQQWTAILDPVTVLLGPVIGTVTGILAGLYPALRAASTQPLEALRR